MALFPDQLAAIIALTACAAGPRTWASELLDNAGGFTRLLVIGHHARRPRAAAAGPAIADPGGYTEVRSSGFPPSAIRWCRVDYFWVDDDHLAIHLLDVCGHGVGPALLGVSALNSIRSRATDLRDPTGVLKQLNATFPMAQHKNMYFTIWYGVYRRSTRTLAYSGGGHPPPLLISNGSGPGREIQKLEGPGPPVGMMPDDDFPTLRLEVAPGSALLIYSDGAIEIFIQPRKLWGVEGLVQFVHGHDMTGGHALDALQGFVKATAGTETLADDFSTVLARFP